MRTARQIRSHQPLELMIPARAVQARGDLVKVSRGMVNICKLVLRAGMMCSACCLCCSMQDCLAGRIQQKSPFGSSGNTGAKRNANPFGPEKGSRSFSEPADLSPTMKPIPIDDTPWYKKITLAQVVSSIGICHGENPLYLRACVVCFKCMSALPGIILVCLHVP